MKKLFIISVLCFFSASSIFAQKAGKGEVPKISEYYSCPKHHQIASHDPGKCSICGKELTLSPKERMLQKMNKIYTCPKHMDVVSHDPGSCPKCGKELNISSKEQMKAEVIKTYTCPMHPEVALTKEGICPKCSKRP